MVLETDARSKRSEMPSSALKDGISDARPLYFLPKDPVTQEVLIPALQASCSVDLMMGYFSSSSFAEIAPGLAAFLKNSNAPVRLVVSPFLTENDFATIIKSDEELRCLAERILIEKRSRAGYHCPPTHPRMLCLAAHSRTPGHQNGSHARGTFSPEGLAV